MFAGRHVGRVCLFMWESGGCLWVASATADRKRRRLGGLARASTWKSGLLSFETPPSRRVTHSPDDGLFRRLPATEQNRSTNRPGPCLSSAPHALPIPPPRDAEVARELGGPPVWCPWPPPAGGGGGSGVRRLEHVVARHDSRSSLDHRDASWTPSFGSYQINSIFVTL